VSTNEERTAAYLKRFDREKALKYLITESAPVIFDVGANVGSTLDEFKGWWPRAMVHCFEPQHECWAALDQRAGRYGDSVKINKVAAGSGDASAATFYTHEISTGISGFNKINLASRDSIELHKQRLAGDVPLASYAQQLNRARQVPVVRLDEYMSSACIARVSLLKLDTQGYEPEVLEGCGACLGDVDVVISELMFFDYYERSLSFSDIERWLLPAGFRLYDISHIAKNPMNGRTDWVDVIYANERIRKRD
jgi:FkbM family methyltransferase